MLLQSQKQKNIKARNLKINDSFGWKDQWIIPSRIRAGNSWNGTKSVKHKFLLLLNMGRFQFERSLCFFQTHLYLQIHTHSFWKINCGVLQVCSKEFVSIEGAGDIQHHTTVSCASLNATLNLTLRNVLFATDKIHNLPPASQRRNKDYCTISKNELAAGSFAILQLESTKTNKEALIAMEAACGHLKAQIMFLIMQSFCLASTDMKGSYMYLRVKEIKARIMLMGCSNASKSVWRFLARHAYLESQYEIRALLGWIPYLLVSKYKKY